MRFIPRFSITNAIAAALTEIERARGFLDAASLSDEWIDSMRSRAFLLEAHHTTHIEGTRLTIEEAADLLAGDDVPGADPDDTRELLNYRDAFKFVSTYLNDGGPITERLILDIHRHLVSGVSEGQPHRGNTGVSRTMSSTQRPAKRYTLRLRLVTFLFSCASSSVG